ncbi:MAG: tetratricopeptide repeat protein [Myxococcota bacterium]
MLPAWTAALVLAPTGVGAADEEPDAATRALEQVGQGAVDLRKGRLLDACAHFRRAVDLTPTWAMAHFELGRCLRLVGDPAGEARAHLEEAVERLPDRPLLWIELARLEEDQGHREAALEAWREALGLSPADARVGDALARLAPAGEGAPTLERLRRKTRRSPSDAAAWRRLAEVAESMGALDEAEEALEHLLELAADPRSAAAALGRFGLRHDRPGAVRRARGALR